MVSLVTAVKLTISTLLLISYRRLSQRFLTTSPRPSLANAPSVTTLIVREVLHRNAVKRKPSLPRPRRKLLLLLLKQVQVLNHTSLRLYNSLHTLTLVYLVLRQLSTNMLTTATLFLPVKSTRRHLHRILHPHPQ